MPSSRLPAAAHIQAVVRYGTAHHLLPNSAADTLQLILRAILSAQDRASPAHEPVETPDRAAYSADVLTPPVPADAIIPSHIQAVKLISTLLVTLVTEPGAAPALLQSLFAHAAFRALTEAAPDKWHRAPWSIYTPADLNRQ